MKRVRKVGAYSDVKPHIYKGINDFLESNIESGIHSFQEHGRMMDLLFEDRPSDYLIVFFTAAVQPEDTYPYFSGRGIAARTGHSLLAFSDPAIAMDAHLTTNWTLGDAKYQYHRDVPSIIRKVAGSKKVIFTGSSAGGFPALYYGSEFPESVSFVFNPRTGLFTPPTHLQFSSRLLFPDMSPRRISELIPTRLDEARNTVLYFQNASDDRYYSSHAIPYLSKQAPSKNIYWKLGEWGEGHVTPTSAEIEEAIQNLVSAPTWGQGALASGASQLTDINEIVESHAKLGYGSPTLTANAEDLVTVGGMEDRIISLTDSYKSLTAENKELRVLIMNLTDKLNTSSKPAKYEPIVGVDLAHGAKIHPTCVMIASDGRNISIGEGTSILRFAEWVGPIRIGKRCFVNRSSYVRANVSIGDNVNIGPFVKLISDGHVKGDESRRAGKPTFEPITIGSGTWIGAGTTVTGGVSIGASCIIAAGSVVTSDIPSNTLAGGIPARKIKDLE